MEKNTRSEFSLRLDLRAFYVSDAMKMYVHFFHRNQIAKKSISPHKKSLFFNQSFFFFLFLFISILLDSAVELVYLRISISHLCVHDHLFLELESIFSCSASLHRWMMIAIISRTLLFFYHPSTMWQSYVWLHSG